MRTIHKGVRVGGNRAQRCFHDRISLQTRLTRISSPHGNILTVIPSNSRSRFYAISGTVRSRSTRRDGGICPTFYERDLALQKVGDGHIQMAAAAGKTARLPVATQRAPTIGPIDVSHFLRSEWLLPWCDCFQSLAMRIQTMSIDKVAVQLEWMLLPLFCGCTGYTSKAVQRKIEDGKWLEGRMYKRAPDGHITINLQEYYRWVDGSGARVPAQERRLRSAERRRAARGT